MARKQIALMILTLMLSSILAGCINNDSDEGDSSSDDENKAVNAMMYVISGSQVPDCHSDNLGFLVFVEDENQFQYCSVSGWSVLEIDLPSGLNGTNGTDGSDGSDGSDGTDGADGSDGEDGVNGSSIISEKTVEEAGENCTYGGMKIVVGLDLDGDWQIDEDTEMLTTFECDPKITYLYNYQSSEYIEVYGTSNLLDGDLLINDYDIRPTEISDDPYSANDPWDGMYTSASSAFAKAAAINDASQYTGVYATADPTVVVASADITQVTLDSTNNIAINGAIITGFTVADNDATASSVHGPRLAQYTSVSDIQVEGGYQGLNDYDVVINGYDIRATTSNDDPYSLDDTSWDNLYSSDSSAIAKAAAINDSTQYTGVTATVEPTVVVGSADITQVTLDSTNTISINGLVISGFTVADNDATVSSNSGPRIAQYTSLTGIDVSSVSQALLDQDIIIIPGAGGLWDDRIEIRSTVSSDDTVSTVSNSASAIAKAAAINDSTQYTGVTATVEPTVVVGSADITSVVLDSSNHIVINGKEISGIAVKDNDATSSLRNQINHYQSTTGVNASLDQNNRLVLTALDGRNIELTTMGHGTKLGLSASPGIIVDGGRITLTSNETFFLDGAAIDKIGNVGGYGQTIFGSVLVDGTENLRSAINQFSDETGVYATLDENHRLVLTAPDGRNICVTTVGNGTRLGLSAAAGTTATGGRITLTSDETFFLEGAAISKLGNVGGHGQTIFGSVLVDGTENLISAINHRSDETGVYATLDENHRLVLTAPDGRNICVTVSGNGTRTGLSAAAGTNIWGGKITLSSDQPFNLSGNAIDKLGHIGDQGETEFGSTTDNDESSSSSKVAVRESE